MTMKMWRIIVLSTAGAALAGYVYGRIEESAGTRALFESFNGTSASSTFDKVAAEMTGNAESADILTEGDMFANGLVSPAGGHRLQRFGDQLSDGLQAEWMVIGTEAGARVVAPAAGSIEYARPFRGYGNLIILQTEDARHIILSGLGRTAVWEGQYVDQGEFVGDMPRKEGRPQLIFELRRGERPVDPET